MEKKKLTREEIVEMIESREDTIAQIERGAIHSILFRGSREFVPADVVKSAYEKQIIYLRWMRANC